MKRAKLLIFMLLALVGVSSAWAVEKVRVESYTVDFNTAIATSSHDFQVASNWGHLVGTGNYDGYGPYYMSYSYYETAGVDGTGCLSAGRQYAGDYGGGTECTDLLISPEVSGTVTLAVKQNASSNSFIEFYAVTGSSGAWVQGDKIEYTSDEGLSQAGFVTVRLDLSEATRIGIRASNCYIDNFTATAAEIIKEAKMKIASAEPTATTGTIYWDQQANGKVLIKYIVTVVNSGEVTLTEGDENYSVSIFNRKTGEVYVTVPVPQTLTVGETSDPFEVSVEVEPSSLWPNTYTYHNMDLRENISNTTVQRAQSTYNAYEPKFIFREAESTSTSSISSAQSWGTITESTTKAFEIVNTGIAPLTVKSITLPEGFTSDNAPAAEFTLAKGEKQTLDITQDASTIGTFAGTLAIVYLNASNEEITYTLDFSATVIGANTWTADFNNSTSTVVYPAGSVAEGGINSDYQYISSGNYNNWIVGRNTSSYKTESNKFITPKLHANAGDKLAFDVKAGYSSSDDYFVKVYVSADRQNWGEPVDTYVYSNVGSSFTTKAVTFDAEGDYYVAFALYGTGSGIDNLVGLEKVDVAHDLYIKSVSWPNTSEKSGTTLSKPSVDIIPLTDEAADAYTVKYVCGATVLAEGTPVALTASASSSKSFSFSWTPEVEETTTFSETKVVFEFTDGTKFETEPFDLTITNEAIFHFLNSTPSSRWYEPTDRSEAISFGKTNTDDTQTFVIFNWGSAPLTVNSIALPEGFTTTTEFPLTVAAFNGQNDGLAAASQSLDITFSAAEAGTFSGDMVITYSGDKTFTLPISGTKLDPTLFYANFDDGGWPSGSVYQSSVSSSNIGSYSTPNYALTSSSITNNLFITPKLTAAEGDKFMFDAKLYSTSWSGGKVVVYAAATRDELVNFDPEADTRTPIFSVSGQDEENAMTTDFQTFEVPAVAGDNYYAFEISGRPYVDELYGLKVAEVAHDWALVSQNVPAEGMQNVALTATVNVANFGIADEAAEDITVTAYLDGEAVATGEAVAIPMSHQLSAAGTQQSVTFRSPKAGTFPVIIEVKAGDYSVQTEAIDVTFAEEVAVADAIQVGTKTGTTGNYSNSTIVDWYNADGSGTAYTDVVYTAEKLAAAGIKSGDKITTIAFKHSNSAKSIKANVTSWVALSTSDSFSAGAPDKTAMQEIAVYDGSTVDFPANFELALNLSEPIVYDGTSDIRIYTETVRQGSGQYLSVTTDVDKDIAIYYNSTSTTRQAPLAYFTLAAEPATIAGTVKNAEGEAVEGAAITLVSTDGDNIQYAGTTDAEGAYSINVIQATREYQVTVVAGGEYEDQTVTVSFADGNVEKDFVVDIPLLKKCFVNTDLATTDGWTPVVSESFKDLGNGLIGTYKVRDEFSAATVDETHLATEYAFGFEARWSSNYASYTQESKIALPEGAYTLTFDVENVNAQTTKATYENRFTVTVGDHVFTDEATEWMQGGSSWTTHSIKFNVAEAAKATLSFGYGTGSNDFALANTPALFVSHLALTFKSLVEGAIEALQAEIAAAEALKTADRTEGLDEFNAAIDAAKALLTATDAAAVNAAVEALKAAEQAFIIANAPLAEGVYYLYNDYSKKFASRGADWGTQAVGDDYGLPFNLVADYSNYTYKLQMVDNGVYYGDDFWMYADCSGDRVRSYTLEATDGGYYVHNAARNVADNRMYIYLKEEGGTKYAIAGNAILDDNISDEKQAVWQFLTQAERDAIVAAREAAEEAAAFENAGVDQDADVDEAEATEVSFTSGNAWTQTIVRSQGGQPATNANGTEMWQATGNFTQTIANLPEGLYKVSIQAFYRNGNSDEDQARVATGYNTVSAYLEANGNKVQVKSWTSDKGEGNDPNNMDQAKAKFDEGKYLSEVYTYVGEDGNLNLTVSNPAFIGNGWFIVGNVKYAKVEELVTLAENAEGVEAKSNVTVSVERSFKEGWNAVVLPFAISAEEIAAQFGENAEVAAYVGDELVEGSTNDVTVKFQKTESVEAGVPYLLYLPEVKSGLKFQGKDIDAETSTVNGTYFDFVGVYATTDVSEGDYFVKGGQFVQATANNKVLPFRSYLQAKGEFSVAAFTVDDVETSVNGIMVNSSEDSIYNVAGQRVAKAKKGIYVINGKKVLVK